MDGSSVTFNASGFMTQARDRFGNAIRTYSYFGAPTDTLISAITDATNHSITPCYRIAICGSSGDGKIFMTRVLSGAGVERIVYYAHDGSGRLIRSLDPDNLSDSLSYGANGLLGTIWNRARKATDVTYDQLRRVKSLKAPAVMLIGDTTGRPTVTYSPVETSVWRPESTGVSLTTRKPGVRADTSLKSLITDPLGNTIKYSQDRFGAPTKITDPYGATVRVTRDGHSRPTRIDDPTGDYSTYTYNFYDQLSGSYDASTGQSVNYFYRDNILSDIAYITGNVVRQDFVYSSGGSNGPAGALIKAYVGNNTSTWPAISGSRLVEWHRVDNLGRDTAVLDSLGHGTRYTYEGTWGNIWKVKDPSGVETRLTYDNVGRVDSTLVPLSARTRVTYGLMNQVLTQTWSGVPGYKVTNTYDSMLAVVKVETPRTAGTSGPVTYVFKYNELGELVRRHDAADTSRVEQFKYDAAGNLRRMITRRADTLDFTYDKAGRLRSRIGKSSTGVVNLADYFQYDSLKGRWRSDSNAVAVNRDTFDFRGRLVQWTQKLNGRVYTGTPTYNSLNQVTRRSLRQTSPAGDSSVVTYAYDGAGLRTSTCAFNATRCVSVSFKGDMARDTVIYNPGTGNAWKVIATNDANHRITGLNYPTALAPMNITFFYDSIGRLRNRTSPKTGFTRRVFSYDSLGALVNACDSTGAQCQNVVNGGTSGNAWAYDSAGNRTAEAGVANIAYGPGNRIQSYGGTTYTYYTDGSTASSTLVNGGGTTVKNYGWDAGGRLREVRSGSGTLIDSMYYDARGRRVIKRIALASEYYVYEGDQVVLDVDGSGSIIREYAWSPGETDNLLAVRTISPADTFAAIVDSRLGTVRGLARFRTAAPVKRYSEAPFGDTAADTGIALRYRFAGRERDAESGLYYMRARYYDPTLGRWLTEDPSGLEGGLGNLYSYGNDPVNFRDPSGLDRICITTWTYQEWYHPETKERTDSISDIKVSRYCYSTDLPSGGSGAPVGGKAGGSTNTSSGPIIIAADRKDSWKGCPETPIQYNATIGPKPLQQGLFEVNFAKRIDYFKVGGVRIPVPGGVGVYRGTYFGPVGPAATLMELPATAYVHCGTGAGAFEAYPVGQP